MKTLYFNSTDNFVDFILEYYERYKHRAEDFTGISIVAPYEVLIDVLNYLVKCTSFNMKNIRLEDGECADYWNEWILTIDSEGQIWVQEVKYDSGYIVTEDDVVFVHNDVNSAFVKKNKEENLIAFEIDESEEEHELDKSNSSIHYSTDEDGETHGFSASRSDGNSYMSYSYYTTEKLDKNIIGDLLKRVGF